MKTKDAIRDLLNDIKDEATEAQDGNSAALCTRMLRDLETISDNYNVEIEIDEDDQVSRLDVDGEPIKVLKYYEESGQVIPDINTYSVDKPVFDGQGNEVEHPGLTEAPEPIIADEVNVENKEKAAVSNADGDEKSGSKGKAKLKQQQSTD